MRSAALIFRLLFFAGVFLVVAGLGVSGFAQPGGPAAPGNNVCTALIQAALTSTDEQCGDTSRNQACYGHILNVAVPRTSIVEFTFESQGDKARLGDIRSLELSPLDLEAEQWGVVLMQVQANLPDQLPGQNVTFIMFGDVQVENTIGDGIEVEAQLTTPASIRIAPGPNRAVIASLPVGTPLIASGKYFNAAGDLWVRVSQSANVEAFGWVEASVLDVELELLSNISPIDQAFNPMQAFYFRTGIGQPQCVEAPRDGLVVQTPGGAGKVEFTVNGIDIDLGSTAYITAPLEEENTCVSLIQGEVELESAGRSLTLYPGERSCVSLDETGIADGPPGKPQPFDPDEIALLGAVLDLLPEDAEIPDPAPTRTPTRTPYIPPTATHTPTETPTETPVPDVQPQLPQPTATFTPSLTNTPVPLPTDTFTPTFTPVPPARFFNISITGRNYTTVNFASTAGPDAPVSIDWDFGDGGTASGPSPSHTFDFGDYDVLATACWADSECLSASVRASIPLCAIDFSVSGSIAFRFVGGSNTYRIFKKDENCNPIGAGTLDESNTSLPPQSTHPGEHWEAIDSADQIIWNTIIDNPPGNLDIPLGSTINR